MAFTRYQASVCDGCRMLKARAWDKSSLGEFELNHAATCIGCGLLIDHATEHKDEDNREKYALIDLGPSDLGRT